MENKKFQRKKEDFICENCRTEVKGDGYTNHCPECLWSKHVDVNPGDRAESCHGMMEPIDIQNRNRKYFILQRCMDCGFERFNSVRDEDDFDTVLSIIKKD